MVGVGVTADRDGWLWIAGGSFWTVWSWVLMAAALIQLTSQTGRRPNDG